MDAPISSRQQPAAFHCTAGTTSRSVGVHQQCRSQERSAVQECGDGTVDFGPMRRAPRPPVFHATTGWSPQQQEEFMTQGRDWEVSGMCEWVF